MIFLKPRYIVLFFFCISSVSAGETTGLNGGELHWLWSLPFLGILFSIALGPVLFSHLWHNHYGKISLLWALCIVIPLLGHFGFYQTKIVLSHTLLGEYIPFIFLVGALYIINSGFHLRIRGYGGPFINAAIMIVGSIFANVIGTTGAALLFIHPLIRMNSWRLYKTHTIIFFIFTVCNIGGALTAIGDPPLFLGFLNGVDFFWPTIHLWPPTLFMLTSLIIIYIGLDGYLFRKEQVESRKIAQHQHDSLKTFSINGKINFLFLFIVIGAVILSGFWKSGKKLCILDCERSLESVLRDVIIFCCAILSYKKSSSEIHEKNQFSWEPIKEVALLFAGIFVTAVPVFSMLSAGKNGPFHFLVDWVYQQGKPSTEAFFWATGTLSAFLDNAPTYLVFFHLAGGNANKLMTEYSHVLAAISCASVYMGAMTYIGNAPNFMVRSIAIQRHIPMPSFIGYIFWSAIVLLPLFYIADVMIQWW